MNNEIKEYTIIVFTENNIGLLNRVTIIFTRRHINIESLTVSASEEKGIHRFTVVVNTTQDMVEKVVKQIEKQVEVLVAGYYENDDIVGQEIALYKMSLNVFTTNKEVVKILRSSGARILMIEGEFVVVEKAGNRAETKELFDKLEPYGILQYVSSGRIAVTKCPKELKGHLIDLDKSHAISSEIRNWKLKNRDE
jgi:acetolactate synthase I/III small subunit